MLQRTLLTIAGVVLAATLGTATEERETWTNVPLVDSMCALKAKDAPDSHSRACALKCSEGGFSIIAADGTILKLDDNGNAKAEAALKASSKTDHLRVTVDGERKGDTIHVSNLKLQ